MTAAGEIAEAISQGESCSRELERLTEALLVRLPLVSAAEIEEFIAQRQDLVSNLQNIDTTLDNRSHGLTTSCEADLAGRIRGYREFRRCVIRRLLELDARIIAAAGRELESLQGGMSRLMQGKHALRGYGKSSEELFTRMDRTA